MSISSMSTNILEAALAYAKRGWPVIPLHTPRGDGTCGCRNRDCHSPGKHPRTRNGLKDATTDEATIRGWWRRWPDANVGIVTGAKSGLVVLDIDPRNGGDDSLAGLEREHGKLPDTVEVITGSSGRHIYFAHPGMHVRSKHGALAPGVDLKADGGYVVAPPSLHVSGQRYAWEWSSQPDDVPLAPMPSWLLTLMAPKTPTANRTVAASRERIPEGQRNTRLMQIAGTLRRYGATPEALAAALLELNRTLCDTPLGDDEVRRVAASAARYPTADGGYALTDLGNAERFASAHGDDLRHCLAWGKWLVWDGARWRIDDTGEVERLAKLTVRSIYAEAAAFEDKETRAAVADWAKRSESGERLNKMIALARSEPGIAINPGCLDADPWLLNCPNGVVDLRTGELREHRREDLQTKMAGAEYDPAAQAPLFEQFLNRILPDPEVRDYLQKWAGYCLTGVVREHRLPIWWGNGGNGKSTLVGALLGVLGDYGKQSAPNLLIATTHPEHPTALADLFGARFVVTIEVGEGKRLAETLAKQLTGGDRIKGRFMRQDYFEWQPTHKLAIICNHRPIVQGTDDGIWRRIDLVPFSVEIPDDEQDPDLPDKLRAEYPGILRWMVEGCLRWQAEGLGRPAAVRAANDQYRQEMDGLGEFVAEQCVLKPWATVAVRDLYDAYVAWCEANGETALSKKRLTQRLRERGVADEKGTGGGRRYRGIGLRHDHTDQVAPRED